MGILDSISTIFNKSFQYPYLINSFKIDSYIEVSKLSFK